MNIKAFFVDALTSALELGIGTPADVIRHVTPDVLAAHLPRPLWARLLTACLGASRVDAQLVVDTIGVANLCEHVPSSIIWSCINEIGARSVSTHDFGRSRETSSAQPAVQPAVVQPAVVQPAVVLAPPPDERPAPPPIATPPAVIGPTIPAPSLAPPTGPEALADVINELDQSDASEPRLGTLRPRSPTAARFRQSNTSVGRLGAARRPQASASASGAVSAPTVSASGSSATPTVSGRMRRAETEVNDNGARDIAVDDSQLVDWQSTDGAGTSAVTDDDFSDLGRKR